jgi:ubiquinol-cytochrome c reductase cytochrome c subunit
VGAVLVALGVLGTIYAALAPGSRPAAASDSAAVTAGRSLYVQGCASCHGLNGQGSDQGPTLVGVGAAAVDFQVGTGRMPLKEHGPQAQQHRQEYTEQQILDMASYVATFGPGPAIPTDLNYADTNEAVGGALFRTNCAQCHNFSGSGGALTYGKYAPSLSAVSPREIYEAMLTGPENMPVFGDQQITPQEKLSIIHFIQGVKNQPDPGGANIGRIGPVPEGLVAWVVGIGVLVLTVIWIGSRA